MTYATQQTAARRQLEASLPAWCALKWYHAVICAYFTLLFVFACYVPIASPETWRDVTIGQDSAEMLAGKTIQRLPYADGIRYLEADAIRQRIVASIHDLGGAQLLAVAFGISITFSMVCWARALYIVTHQWYAVLATVAIPLACYNRLSGLSGLLLGQCALGCLVLLLLERKKSGQARIEWARAGLGRWLLVVGLIVTWANMHLSVIVGLALLLFVVVQRGVTIVHKQTWRSLTRDAEFRRRVYLFELSVVSTLATPFGIELWRAAFWWPANPMVQSLGGWDPPLMFGLSGLAVSLGWLVWIYATQRGKSRATLWSWCAGGATIAVAASSSAIVWFMPLMLMAIAAAVGRKDYSVSLWDKIASDCSDISPVQNASCGTRPMSFAFTLVAGLFLWLGFCLSPLGDVFGGRPRTEQQLVGKHLPVAGRQFVLQNVTDGLIVAPIDWSDYLAANSSNRLLLNYDAARVPRLVAQDHDRICRGVENWHDLAMKYAVSNIVIDKSRQSTLLRQVRRGIGGWKIVFEDEMTLIAQRKGESS